MRSCWLRRGEGKDCLLFMAGWGMGPEPFQDADFGCADVLMLYDYRSMDDSFLAELPQEKPLHLLAWSMGVWAAAWLAEHRPCFAALRFSTATAVGGTLRPIDEQRGIPTESFEKMLDEFSPLVLENFYRSMFSSSEEAERFLVRRPQQRPWQELREELRCLRDLCHSCPPPPDIYSRRIVTSRDRIFPARNQLRAWGRDCCETLPLPHFPFQA
ncbi:alpha/beta fold hydrolase [Candidatus Electronema sp. TJ]|uniref:alpha/beta fold hydrolase n=1 Tax=Candidatus Electronema sp. TJ TaxID=3401573 RepID=UPI003AA90B86